MKKLFFMTFAAITLMASECNPDPTIILATDIIITPATESGNVEMIVGINTALEATVLPEDAALKDVTWSSNNEPVASVNAFGIITGHKAGIATIRATAVGGRGVFAEKTILVYASWEPVMVWVQGGTFLMGSTPEQEGEGDADEFPVHPVTLSDYYMGKFEVTQALWETVMGSDNNPSYFRGDELPLEQMSWDDMVGTSGSGFTVNGIEYHPDGYIHKLYVLSGKKYRLPTEAEWEYAARGGNKSEGYKFCGGNILDNVAWYYVNSGGTTHPVGTMMPNELGLYDMNGNVDEYCTDWWSRDYYSVSPLYNPTGPETPTSRVLRGGSWGGSIWETREFLYRVSHRSNNSNVPRTSYIGFRLVMSL